MGSDRQKPLLSVSPFFDRTILKGTGEPVITHAGGFVHESIRMVEDGYMRSAIDYFEEKWARPSMAATLVITMWSRMAFDEENFGWGGPLFSARLGFPGTK
ncbi:unnamed protein product [Linum tenue]|uniref:Uncharacterized protein n=1 Tax=Linum tenue TaxID=586396 RepID=A0AAV0I132_9ROSI|nr:unnamed protein product [Linum tenue]